MRVFIRHHGLDLTTDDRQMIERVMGHALDRIEHDVLSVTVFLADINGPKGGIDKECRVLLHLKQRGFCAIEDKDDDLTRMMDRIADRVHHTVSRHLDKQHNHRRMASSMN